jgi:hypothetical protein
MRVSAAKFAVLSAQQSGVPAGDLDRLCQCLHLAAEGADRAADRKCPLDECLEFHGPKGSGG